MLARPFKNLLARLPRFSPLVKRREFHAALAVLRDSAHITVEGANVSRDWHGRSDIGPAPARAPWQISGGARSITVAPCWLRIPGAGACVWPQLGGVDIRSARGLAGPGFVCISIQLRQAPRAMAHSTWSFDDPDAPIEELTATASVLLLAENTVEVSGTPQIVVTESLRGTAAVIDPDGHSATYGTYLIPLGHVSAGGVITQYLSRPLQITLKAGFLQVTQLE